MSIAVPASEDGVVASPDGSRVFKGRRPMCADLDISIRTFSELEAQHVIVPVERGRGGRASVYDAVETLKQYLRHVRQERPAGSEREARMRRDLAQAALGEQLHQKRAGEMVDRGDVAHVFGLCAVAIRNAMLRLPTSLGAVLAAAESAEDVERILKAEIHSVLRELSNWQMPPAAPTTTDAPPARASRTNRKGRTP